MVLHLLASMTLQKPRLPDSYFNRDRHIKFWLRCSTLLPEPYTSGDSTRLSFGYFIVAGLDLMGILETKIEPEIRQAWIEWIYSCQTSSGGFRGSPTMSLGQSRNTENEHWDPGNLPSTFFALITLLLLGDDLSRLRRHQCLSWLSKLQRPNGSFGEFLYEHDSIEGSHDLRHCMCASAITFILQGPPSPESDAHFPFDEDRLRQYISSCQAYDGGFSESPFREAHSGLNYCAIATLDILDRLHPHRKVTTLSPSLRANLKWILDRQTTWLQEPSSDTDSEDDDTLHTQPASMALPFSSNSSQPDPYAPEPISHPLPFDPSTTLIGFNGRCNKIADTCYSFWNVGALACVLPTASSHSTNKPTSSTQSSSTSSKTTSITLPNQPSRPLPPLQSPPSSPSQPSQQPSPPKSTYHSLLSPQTPSIKSYILSLTQHPTLGGFSKMPGYPPDILHSYLGLATLSLLQDGQEEFGLKELDPAFAVSKEALGRLDGVWKRWRGEDLQLERGTE